MKTQHPTLFSGAILFAASLLFSHAAVLADDAVVAWGPSPNYVTGHTNAIGLSDGAVSFSDTSARNPTGIYPGEQPSGTFYGGAVSTNPGGITYWRISNGATGANDTITFCAQLASGETATAIHLWNKTDFLAGHNGAQPVKVSSFSATLNHTGANTSTMSGIARWVVRVGNSYYVSDTFATSNVSFSQYSLSDPSSVSWFSLTPSVSLTAIGAQWTSPDFSNVTSVGIWQQLSAKGSVSVAAGNIAAFTVTAAAPVPESASVALLAGVLVAGIAVLARRKK